MRLGPGAYEPKQVRDDTCLTDYKLTMKQTEPRVNIHRVDREIGPGYYYAKDDYVKPKLLGFKIVLPEVNPMEEFNEVDRKLPLDVNYEAVDKRVAGGLINPQPINENPLKFLQVVEDTMTVKFSSP